MGRAHGGLGWRGVRQYARGERAMGSCLCRNDGEGRRNDGMEGGMGDRGAARSLLVVRGFAPPT